ncbi:MAG: DUF937 domain-containing protein [Dokdonella sp.]
MTDITRTVYDQIDASHIQAMAQQLGISSEQAQSAVQQALPMLVGGLARNAQSEHGAGELMGALQRDHAGVDLGRLLGGLLGGGGATANANNGSLGGLGSVIDSVLGGSAGRGRGSPANTGGGGLGDIGGAILGHIFGGREERATENLGQASGIGGQSAARLMAMLAPLVMAALGKMVQNRGMGANDLGQALSQENEQIQKSGGGGLLNSLLDRDGDGDVDASDLMQAGLSAINMFGRRS